MSDVSNFNFFEKKSIKTYLEKKLKITDRSVENVSKLWKQNKGYVYTFFSKTKYDKLCKQVVNDLITVHDTIIARANYKEFYEKYNVSDSEFKDFPSTDFYSKYDYSWPFSFWDRRLEEQNELEVYQILIEIREHYTSSSE